MLLHLIHNLKPIVAIYVLACVPSNPTPSSTQAIYVDAKLQTFFLCHHIFFFTIDLLINSPWRPMHIHLHGSLQPSNQTIDTENKIETNAVTKIECLGVSPDFIELHRCRVIIIQVLKFNFMYGVNVAIYRTIKQFGGHILTRL